MPATPIYAFPYPALSDPPNGPSQMQSLAVAVENVISPIAASVTPLPRGTVGVHRPTANVSGNLTTEVVCAYVTFTAVSGRRYKATWNGDLTSTFTNANGRNDINNGYTRIRYKTGSSSTAVDGTLFESHEVLGLSSTYSMTCHMCADWVAPSSGTFTVSATISAVLAAGYSVNQIYDAGIHLPKLIVEDIGL